MANPILEAWKEADDLEGLRNRDEMARFIVDHYCPMIRNMVSQKERGVLRTEKVEADAPPCDDLRRQRGVYL